MTVYTGPSRKPETLAHCWYNNIGPVSAIEPAMCEYIVFDWYRVYECDVVRGL